MLQGVKEEIAQIEEKETCMSKDRLELQHKIEKYEDVVKTNLVKIKHWKKQVRDFCIIIDFFFNHLFSVIVYSHPCSPHFDINFFFIFF